MNARARTVVVALASLALAACDSTELLKAQRVAGADPKAGRSVIAAVECGACHTIPGVRGANGIVGPPLTGFGNRQLIAGIAPNTPDILSQWVRDAPSIDPETGMPQMPITADQARDVAAYLYTLR
ncbi:c-type cytochrome [Chelativorans intermedius]|uniref:C-type cytochrome n=1 Tax=Chelativorans intermedius TaxID=515947 RepID=A0ABV6D861_9HYPH